MIQGRDISDLSLSWMQPVIYFDPTKVFLESKTRPANFVRFAENAKDAVTF